MHSFPRQLLWNDVFMIESPIKTKHGLALWSPRRLCKHYQWDGSCTQVGILTIVPAEQFHQFHPQQ